MSPDRQTIRQIQDKLKHLNELENLASPDEDLKDALMKSHNSVNLSFEQMLAYVDNIREKIPEGDIRKLLDTYRSMAEMFYTQCELTLLIELTRQKEIQEQTDRALNYIEGLRNNSPAKAILEQVKPRLTEVREIARDEYEKLREKYPSWLQDALNKLRDEWQRLHSFAVGNQMLTDDEKLDQALKAVVEVAAHSVGVEAERIAIVPGNAFALNFFTYLDNLAVLVVPIYSVQSLWEWSIFWHELAGYKVRRLNRSVTIERVRDKLTNLHQLYRVSDEQQMKDLLRSVTWDSEYCQNYFSGSTGIFRQQRPNLDDLGDFEHQFARMVTSLMAPDNFQAYDQIKADGWCVDWFEELFEDAWSVVTLGEPFLELFENILARNAAKDTRHPPLKVRLSVAKEILKLIDPKTTIQNTPDTVEGLTAQQILKFILLLRAAARQYKRPGIDPSNDPQLRWQSDRDELFDRVKAGILQAIEDWSEKYLMASRPLLSVRRHSKNVIEIFSDPEVGELVSRLHEYEVKQIKSTYKELLKNRSYEQLLQLSFMETDYHTGKDIELREGTTPYWVKSDDWNSPVWSAQRHPVGNGKLPTETIITEVDAKRDWRVNTADWVKWFKMPQ